MSDQSPFVKVKEFCAVLGIARTTFDDWRAKGKAPECFKLPNGQLRIRRSDMDAWLESCKETAA